MRKKIYEDMIEELCSIVDGNGARKIKHIDLWNQNVAFIEGEDPWAMPAVFIEFGEINWKAIKGAQTTWKGEGTMLLHIVTPWKGSAAEGSSEMDDNLACWALADEIHHKIEGGCGSSYSNISLSQTLTNHNHEDIVENIEVYKVNFTRT